MKKENESLVEGFEDIELVEEEGFIDPSEEESEIKDLPKEIADLIKELKLKCLIQKVPMFISVVTKEDGENTEYYNDVVYAAVEKSKDSKRIANLIVSMLGAKATYPDYVQKALTTLETWVANETTYSDGIVLSQNKFRDYVDIGTGRMIPSILPDNDNAEEDEGAYEVLTTKELKKRKEGHKGEGHEG